MRYHNQDTCLIRRMPPSRGTLAFSFSISLSFSLSFEASAQKWLSCLTKPPSLRISDLTPRYYAPLSLEHSGRALLHSSRLPHWTRGSRESRKSISLFSISLSLYLYCLISVRVYRHAYQIHLDLVNLVAETLNQTPEES